ncbi:MAG: DUF4424 family protein, partial [Hyphomicrobiaceae bacterium]
MISPTFSATNTGRSLARPFHICRRTMPAALLLLALAMMAASPTARAGETAALIPSSGVLFPSDEGLSIVSEDITLSTEATKITYVVRNTSAKPITKVLSWPLPDIDPSAFGDAAPIHAAPQHVNHAGVSVSIDGKTQTIAFEQRAIAFGRDVTALLNENKVPLNPLSRELAKAIARLGSTARQTFLERSLYRQDDEQVTAGWALRTTAYWRQVFPVGARTSLSVSAVPVAGRGTWDNDSRHELTESYCIDPHISKHVATMERNKKRRLKT